MTLRRGNKSHKVPNVKLRPAQPSSSSTSTVSKLRAQCDSWVQDSDETNQPETQSGIDLCPRPFKNVVVCATGVVDKPTLFKQALELGATPISAFTDRVTHLVANDHGGAKYMCALERKIPIMQSSWITESYEVWLRGDDVDLNKMMENHRLPVFTNVTVSLSGIDDLPRRTQINKLLTYLGGTYVKNLERPVKVTHLLCSGDEETDKMRYAEKFNKRGEAKIWIVWEEWFWDSVEFGGRFGEERYAVGRPRPERKVATDVPAPAPPVPNPPNSDQGANPPPDVEADEEEVASVKRVPAVTLQLWETLLKPRGFEINVGKLIRSPTKSQAGGGADRGDVEMSPLHAKTKSSKGKEREREGDANGSVISSFRRVNSFAPPAVVMSAPRQPFRRIASIIEPNSKPKSGSPSRSRSGSVHQDNTAGPSKTAGTTTVGSSNVLFSGLKFRALGEARCANVKTEIEGCGGRMVSQEEEAEGGEDVDFIVVRLVSGSKFYRDELDGRERSKYRTECWLERCMFEERICSPEEHISFTPLRIETPVPGAEHVNLSFSGLDQSEACWIRRLLRAIGANLAPNFSRRSTHLLCPSGTGAKFDKAREWGVPVVSMRWLEDVIRTGVVGGVKEYLVEPRGGEVELQMEVAGGATQNAGVAADVKGKGSAGPSHKSTVAELEVEIDMQETRIPSSTSPSPMKIPRSRDGSRGSMGPGGASPAKVPHEVTKALQESITSLLGKRQNLEEDANADPGQQPAKAGKRARPQQKSKPQSRHESGEFVAPPSIIAAAPPPSYARSLSPFESYDELSLIDGARSYEESMRVTYEDPGQRDEKKRLMSLFETQPQSGEDSCAAGRKGGRKGPAAVRRSTRVAGF